MAIFYAFNSEIDDYSESSSSSLPYYPSSPDYSEAG